MWGLRSSRTLVIAAAVVAFTFFCVLPVAYMMGSSFIGATGAPSPFAALLLDGRQRALLFNTGVLGIGTALGATLIGAPLGVALARVRLPFKAVLRIALAAPVLVPPYVLALTWIYLGGSDWLSGGIFSVVGAVVVLSLAFYPLSMLATEVAVRRIESRLEEAALLVAGPARVLRGITLPLALPGVTAAALLVFVLAVSEFSVPGLLRVRVFTTEVFTAFAALYDFGRATLLALPLLLLSIIVAALAVVFAGDRLIATRRGSAARSIVFEGWERSVGVAVITMMLIALVVPLGVLLREALRVESVVAALEGSRPAIINSLTLAATGATIVLVVAVALGYARARASYRGGLVADVLMVVLFAVPSTVVGIGLIGLWNQPGLVGAVYGTETMLLLAYLARFIPVAVLGLAASMRHVPVSHEEAAAVSGARWLRTMIGIVMPQVKLGLLATWIVVFILAFGELGASILVAPPGESTLPIRIYTLIANTPSSHVAALALLQSLVIFCPIALLGLALAARGRS